MRNLILLAIVLCFSGCSTLQTFKSDPPEVQAAKSLTSMGELLKTAGEAGDRLCDSGKIAPEPCGRMREVWRKARPAYVSAVDATVFGMKYAAADGTAVERMKAAQGMFFPIYTDFMALAAEFNLLGGEK